MFETSKTSGSDATAIRALSADEVDTVSGAKIIAIIVLAGCTDPIQWRPGRDPRIIIFNPWINPGTPERAGTGTTF
jgi:hypothetical protein